MSWGGGGGGERLVGFWHEKKMPIEGKTSQKHKGKRGGQEKYFSKTLKWHNVFILKNLAILQT